MTLCEKCIHRETCNTRDYYDENDERALTYCADFKNKADFVEVVRCQKCKYWTGKHYVGVCIENNYAIRYANEYCSRGKRRDT